MRFGWTAYVVPFLFVYSPSLLLKGGVGELALTTAVGGVWLVSAGMAGYFTRPLSPPLQAAFIVSGLFLLIPAGAFTWGPWTDLAGAAMGGLLVARGWTAARRARTA